MQFLEYLDYIEEKLKANFDIKRNYVIDDYKYDFFAEYHLRSERYILLKKAVIAAMECNEYCLIKHFSNIKESDIQIFTDSLIKAIEVLVNLDEGHMSSIITGVIVSEDKPDDDILKIIQKFKFHKGFFK